MADTTMNSATIPDITPATNDLLLAWDASAAANGEFPISALTTLQQGTFATLAGGNNLTGDQNVAGIITLLTADLGANVLGRRIWCQRNSAAGGAAPGLIMLTTAANATQRIWADDSGILRMGAVDPTGSNINSGGTVVGTQTSNLASKDLEGDTAALEDVLAAIAQGAEAVRRFVYKPPTFPLEGLDQDGHIVVLDPEGVTGARPHGGEAFEGVVIDFAPRYGMDATPEHPEGTALNTITVIGDLLRAVSYLAERVAALEAASK